MSRNTSMPAILLFILLCSAIPAWSATPKHNAARARDAALSSLPSGGAAMAEGQLSRNRLDQLRMRFTENRGQIVDDAGRPRPDILYMADAGSARLYFTRTGLTTVYVRLQKNRPTIEESTGAPVIPVDGLDYEGPYDVHRVGMTLLGANPHVAVTSRHELPGYANYYYAHCPQGITGVRSYGVVQYGGVYRDVDLVYHRAGPETFKYEFVVRPGADPTAIRMRFEGADALRVDEHGNLHVETELGEQLHGRPFTFTSDGTPVDCAYRIDGTTVTFTLGDYDRGRTLVIDPWGRHIGGSEADVLNDLTVHSTGDIAIIGNTPSTDYPTQSPYQSYWGAGDIFVTSFSSSGSISWSTYFGGTDGESGYSLDYDASGNLFILGRTLSSNFPQVYPFQLGYNDNGDYVVAKFSSSGALAWSSCCGGSAAEGSSGSIRTDPDGNAIFIGFTLSLNWPTYRAFQTNLAGAGNVNDAVVAKVSAGGCLVWSTYLGGAQQDYGYRLSVDPGGKIYCTGGTASFAFPLVRPYKATTDDMFITKFDTSGTVIWSTYFGGSSTDQLYPIWAGSDGTFTIAGLTSSGNLPVTNAFQPIKAAGSDGALVRFDSACANIQCCTYIGGNATDYLYGIDGNAAGAVAICGATYSTDFPVLNAFQPFLRGFYQHTDAVMGVLNWNSAAGFQPAWMTYFGDSANYGQSGNERANGIGFDQSGNVTVGGRAPRGLDTLHTWMSPPPAGKEDGFVVQLDAQGNWPVQFTAFTARLWDGRVRLDWRCSAEADNSGFEIQRSFTGSNGDWEARGFVAGAGTSAAVREYVFYDDSPFVAYPERSIFYRLRQIDFDGSVQYSPVVEVFPGDAGRALSLAAVSPQPASGEVVVRFSLPASDVLSLALYDALGREVALLQPRAAFPAGSHAVSASLRGIAPGAYFLHLRGEARSAVAKVVVR